MSKSACFFLCLTIATGIAGMNTSAQAGQTTAFVVSGISASLLLLTLIMGRRIKFDPVLR
ncbi:PA3371 family protein [Pseudomonas sp. AMR01]|uniref:PA3371 family protein n=1 Tax=Pseudomonas sp. AMR01 TaxID=3064904 RepID=UPI0035C15673